MNILTFLEERKFSSSEVSTEALNCPNGAVEIPCLILAANDADVIFSYLGSHYRIATDQIIDFAETRSVSCLPGSTGYPLLIKVAADAEISSAACTTAQALIGNAPAIFSLPHKDLSARPREDFAAFENQWLIDRGLISDDESKRKIRASDSMTKGDSTPTTHDTTCWGSASGEGENIAIDDNHEDDTESHPVLDPLENDDLF